MDDKPKKRKRTSGVLRDKDRTKAKMVQAVGKVLLKKGYTGLNASAIAKEAGIDKSLVWTYFGSLDNLVEEYILQRDFLNAVAKNDVLSLLENTNGIPKEAIYGILHNQLETLLKDKVLQKIIHWEIGESKPFLRNLADKREELGEAFFEVAEPAYKNANVDLRGILAVLIAGVYYLALHGKTNGSLFCGIDINEPAGEQRIKEALYTVIEMAHQKAQLD
ncbi:TetR/AcrR family transcriptional regulator [Paenimyroides aestuarii]|uniref:TetR/AcrR family transcriptional regulator n=1 Tax=Paenimyroides aestuarii TaxID=2968490 RepID=A0ABY5NR69_9FLAO|nr:TetR/AcrR family transcriptional regulator [Paenimyroides aestuarii]UUV21050.1 TetR/AcrR family transcriptional regulator [Paenimyroides aestuarii]